MDRWPGALDFWGEAMTPAALRVLKHLADNPSEDIICSGIICYCGIDQISRRTVTQLLRIVAISKEDWAKEEYYSINGTGHALLRRPELENEIKATLLTGGSFTFVDDKLVRMP